MKLVFETSRLNLRQFTDTDAAFILELVNDPSWLQFIGDKGVRTLADAQMYILEGPVKSYNTLGFGLWRVSLKEDDTPIGMCGLIKRDLLREVDLGFAFLPAYVGKGYAFEAAAASIQYAWEELALPRIAAIVNEDNTRSLGLLSKLGFVYDRPLHLPGQNIPILLLMKHLP